HARRLPSAQQDRKAMTQSAPVLWPGALLADAPESQHCFHSPEEARPGFLHPPGETKAVWASGSSETKTYGKGIAVREPKYLQTLPRRSIFGKDIDASLRVFKVLYVLLFPTEALFSGKLSCTAIAGRC